MKELLRTLRTLIASIYTALKLVGKEGLEAWRFLVANYTKAGVFETKAVFEVLNATLPGIVGAVAQAMDKGGPQLRTTLKPHMEKLASVAFDAATKDLLNQFSVKPEDWRANLKVALGEAWANGATSAGVSAAFEACLPEKLNTFNGVGPLFSKLAGFEEVLKSALGPILDGAIGLPARYDVNSQFLSRVPVSGEALKMHARRLISDEVVNQLLSFAGIGLEYREGLIQNAYTRVSPRALAQAYQDVPFPRDDVQKLLENAGFRDDHIKLLLDALEARSTQNLRNQYLAATLTAAERGTISDAELDASLDNLNFSATAKNLARLTVSTKKLEQLDQLYRRSISEAYAYGQITDADYVPALRAIGIADADAQAHYAVDSIKKRGKDALAAQRAELKVEDQRRNAAVRAAEAAFLAGEIDVAALELALVAAGVDAPTAGFLTSLMITRRDSRRVDVYGKLVDPHNAPLLREQVAAVKEQVAKKLIGATLAEQQLAGLGIPAGNIKALVSAWVASADKELLPP
jgi:hypothetical protein